MAVTSRCLVTPRVALRWPACPGTTRVAWRRPACPGDALLPVPIPHSNPGFRIYSRVKGDKPRMIPYSWFWAYSSRFCAQFPDSWLSVIERERFEDRRRTEGKPRNIERVERAKGPEAVGRNGEIWMYLREGDLKVKPFARRAERGAKSSYGHNHYRSFNNTLCFQEERSLAYR